MVRGYISVFLYFGLICEIITANSQVVHVLMQNQEVIVLKKIAKFSHYNVRTRVHGYIHTYTYIRTYVYVYIIYNVLYGTCWYIQYKCIKTNYKEPKKSVLVIRCSSYQDLLTVSTPPQQTQRVSKIGSY